jgi:cytochrome c peroxidase
VRTALALGGLLALGVWLAGGAGSAAEGQPQPVLHVPAGLSVILPVPADSPLTAERVALGRRLFFEPRLSKDNRLSCASCHRPERAFADGRPVAVGAGRRAGRRNAPSLLNRAYASTLFWDGRAASLEEQALAPMISDVELANTYDEIERRLRADAGYVAAFREAFGPGDITRVRIAQALASFQRTLLSGGSPVDRYELLGESGALTPAAARGRALFRGRARCQFCHDGPLFTDERFHNTGVSWGRQPLDLGRFEVTGLDHDRGAFRTPSLRDIARTAPYMHDGSMATLAEVVAFYDRGGNANPHLDGLLRPLHLTLRERRDLVAFLEALTGG